MDLNEIRRGLRTIFTENKMNLAVAFLVMDCVVRMMLNSEGLWPVFLTGAMGLMLLGAMYSKKAYTIYGLIIGSGLSFYLVISAMEIGFYNILSLMFPLLLIYALLLPVPFYTLGFSSLFVLFLQGYEHQVGQEAFRGNLTGLMINGLLYSVLAYLIRKLKSSNEELRKSDEDTKMLLSLMPEAIYIHTDKEILYANKEGLKLVGLEKESDIIGLSPVTFVHPNYLQYVRETIDSIITQTSITRNVLFKIEKKNEILDIECSSVKGSYKNIPCLITFVNDVTLKQKAADEILRKSDKLKIVGQMAAGIAHEIRNPLTAIKGFLQFIEPQQSDKNKEYVDIMLRELERINFIVNEFLFLSKPQSVKFQENHILSIVNQVIKLMSTQSVMNNVEIKVNCEPDLPPIRSDENQLKQVFINLIKNAVEAMPNGGLLQIDLQRDSINKILIVVRDQGCGIEKERLSSLGEPFYTTKEKGTGLGLMVCYKIIENHFGSVTIESEMGKGTTIKIELPVSSKALLDNGHIDAVPESG